MGSLAFFNNGDCYTPDYGVVAFYMVNRALAAPRTSS